jgi:hypothetical protein
LKHEEEYGPAADKKTPKGVSTYNSYCKVFHAGCRLFIHVRDVYIGNLKSLTYDQGQEGK